MADPTNPEQQIADADAIAAALKSLTENSDGAQSSLAGFNQKIADMGKALQEGNSNISNTLKSMGNIGIVFLDAKTHILGASDSFKAFSQDFEQSSAKLGDSVKPIAAMLQLFEGMARVVPLVGKAFGALAGQIGSVVSQFGAAAERAKGLEAGYIQLLSTTGDLSQAFDANGLGLEDFDSKIAKFTHDTVDMAKESGMTVDAMAGLRKELGMIPEVLGKVGNRMNDTVVTQKDQLGTMNTATAAAKVATVTFGGLAEVQKELATAYQTLNKVGTDALEFVSSINEASNVTKLRFTDVRDSIEGTTKMFQYLGDTTQGALNILTKFGPAFKEVGLSSQQSVEMIRGMTEGIGRLDTASKSFISQRSGGPGGLQGAFKIDQLIADGKLDQVVQMAQDSFKKQLGGSVVTLQQASESGQAAQQYQRQLALLKSSAFGGMVTDDKQASKFFEAMQSGSIDKMRQTVDPKAALANVATRGEQVQSRNRDAMTMMAADLHRIATDRDFFGLRSVREMIGSRSGFAGELERQAAGSRNAGTRARDQFDKNDVGNPINSAELAFGNAINLFKSATDSNKQKLTAPPQNSPMVNAAESSTPVVGPSGIPIAPVGRPGMAISQAQDGARTRLTGTQASPTQAIMGPSGNLIRAGAGQALQNRMNTVQAPRLNPTPGAVQATTARSQGSAETHFPSRLTLDGKLDVKCQNCGTVTKGEILAEAHAQATDRAANQAYGVKPGSGR